MTLLAAFRCKIGGHPGVVICADSQETCGNYRITVDKLNTKDVGEYQLIIGGAGNTAELIDGQVRGIEQSIPRWPACLDEEAIRLRLENLLRAYNVRHVSQYPAAHEDKELQFILCLRDKHTSNIYLWKSRGTVILPVESYALLGWEEAVYRYEVTRLYRPELGGAQAILLGIHLFSVAENNLYISRPTQVIVVHRDGVQVEDADDIRDLEARLKSYSTALNQLFLACPDTSMNRDEFSELFANFKRYVMELREHYHGNVIGRELWRALNPNWKPDPISQLPSDDVIEHSTHEGRPTLKVKFTISEPEE